MGQTLRKMLNRKRDDDQESSRPSPIIVDDGRDSFGLHAERPTLEHQEHSRNLLRDNTDKVKRLESATKESDDYDPELTGLLQDQDDLKEPESSKFLKESKEDEDLGFTVDIKLLESSPSKKESSKKHPEKSSDEPCKCKEGESCSCGDDCRCGDDCECCDKNIIKVDCSDNSKYDVMNQFE